jgi:hypothetical protein
MHRFSFVVETLCASALNTNSCRFESIRGFDTSPGRGREGEAMERIGGLKSETLTGFGPPSFFFPISQRDFVVAAGVAVFQKQIVQEKFLHLIRPVATFSPERRRHG